MKNKLFINNGSYGHNSISKWKKISSRFPDFEPLFIEPPEFTGAVSAHLKANNLLFIGGGDGTLHHVLNSVFSSDDDFERIRIGYFGLGSSCSFLRSQASVKKENGIPYLVNLSKETKNDLGHATITNKAGKTQSKFFAVNGSVGFLALGNLLFNNQNGITSWLKTISTEAANNYVFVKSLFRYSPIPISINRALPRNFLNIQFLKSKYYTGDYFFERENKSDSGLIDFHFFDFHGKINTLNVFYNLTLENEYLHSAHTEFRGAGIELKAEQDIPIELDGEIYYGCEIKITCAGKKMRILG